MQVTRVIYRLVSQTTALRQSHSSYNNAYCSLSSSVARPRCLQQSVKSAVYYSQSTEQQRKSKMSGSAKILHQNLWESDPELMELIKK